MLVSEFGGEERSFDLKLGQIRALEKEFNLGYYAVFDLIQNLRSSIDHVIAVIRLGLIGAGMEANQAQTLALKTIRNEPFLTYLPLAREIMKNAIFGGDEVATSDGGKPAT